MNLTEWIRSRAASGQPLNLHAVMRERPDLIKLAFIGPNPRGWRRSLIDAGVDPYKIVHSHGATVECALCGRSLRNLGTHTKVCHDMSGKEYRGKFGSDREISSESFRASRFKGEPIVGIFHWEHLWSRHYVIDWIIRLHEEGHNVNFKHLFTHGNRLWLTGKVLFGSWDSALRAAGLDPCVERAKPPYRQWTRTMVVDGLRNFAKLKQEDWKRQMSNPLRTAMIRFFKSPEAASRAVGLKHEEISSRAIFQSGLTASLVEEVRALECLKGRERKRKLDAIFHKNTNSWRIVTNHFGSLKKLAVSEGIDLRAVATEIYRDEADVQHDLDLLERDGIRLSFSSLKNGHKRLYNVIRETGWGTKRLKRLPKTITKFPPCNPRSGLLRDRMIILRRRLRISMPTAARKAGVSKDCWSQAEKGQTKPYTGTVAKIERLLAEHGIPVSTAPNTPCP
ncbi:MAG: hypothetical protein WCS43_12175 [Verrucomicrobiota bacterium]